MIAGFCLIIYGGPLALMITVGSLSIIHTIKYDIFVYVCIKY